MSTKKQAVLGIVIVVAIMLFVPGLTIAGSLEPTAAPASTMKTLDEIPPTWSQIISCETTTNCPRFQAVLGNAGVLDKETGLVWEKSPSTLTTTWQNAVLGACQNLSSGQRKGWRLPTAVELASLVYSTRSNPSLPAGHPFTNVQLYCYWSVTSNPFVSTEAWGVEFTYGAVYSYDKTMSCNKWCVRGGEGL